MEQRRKSAFFRGADGMRRTDDELERAKQKAEQRKTAGGMPFRFRVGVGETRRLIVVDDKPDFFMYEHALKDAEGNWGKLFSGCVKTFDNCPVCQATAKESYYAMFLTCVDLTPFTLRDGTEVEFSRKLLVVKPAQQKKFLRFYNKEGTLRGAMFEMTRDGDKDSSIGNDIEFVEFIDEDQLAEYTRTWKDREGKKHVENCSEPFEYEHIFEEPTTEKLRLLVGGEPAPGSRGHTERELGRRAPERSASREEPPRGRSAKSTDDDWEEDDDSAPFDPDERPAKTSARTTRPAETATRPATRTATRRAVDDDEEVEEPAPKEEATARSAARRTRR